MQEHFQFTDEEYKKLLGLGVSIEQLFKFANEYDFSGQKIEIGFMNLFYFIDQKGDFFSKPNFSEKLICRAIFEKLNTNQKMEIMDYLSGKLEKEF